MTTGVSTEQSTSLAASLATVQSDIAAAESDRRQVTDPRGTTQC